MKRLLCGLGVVLALGGASAAVVSYRLARETVPNGSFDRVGPKWQQLRPDEGEKLAIIPEGWLVGYQGGQRTMPLAGKDPDTGGRCMDFLYGAGRVDLYSPIFPLDGAGTYLLSLRTRSIVGPTDHALRVVVRLLRPEGETSPDPPAFETRIAAGPPEREWATRTSFVAVGSETARAEIHLIKDDDGADFLVDDVSLRRIEAAPRVVRQTIDVRAPEFESLLPVVYLGPIESATLSLEPVVAPRDTEPSIQARTGTTPTPDAGWEEWRTVSLEPKGGGPLPFHILGTGLDLFAQLRILSGTEARIVIRTTPAKESGAGIRIEQVSDDEDFDPGAGNEFRIPPYSECVNGPLAPLRERAVLATKGVAGDRRRAAAIRDAVAGWIPFTASGDPPAGSASPGSSALLADCNRGTPLHCRGRAVDAVAAACRCLGLVCLGVGTSGGEEEGFQVWLDDERTWGHMPFLQQRPGWDMATIAVDLNWGQRGWKKLGLTDTGEQVTPVTIDEVHADFAAAGPRALRLRLENSMPDFDRYVHRFNASAPWKPVEGDLLWRLAPGDNSLEIAARNHAGKLGPVATYRARAEATPEERAAPYAGLRALSGDPHVHTGLALYAMLNPKEPLARGTPEGAFASARKNGLDWAAVTDYSANIDDPRVRKGKAAEWDHLRDVATKANEPGRFAAFVGLEFDGGGYSTRGGTGRKLILLPDASPDTYCSPMTQNVGDCPVVEDAYRYARAHGGAVIAATPCAAAGEDTDWSRFDPILSLMELPGGSCETGPGGLIDVAVRRGLPVGAAGGGNSRKGIAGESDRTICWAKEITRASLIDAMRARRCYFSAAGHLELAFSMNGAPMGASVEAVAPTSWSVSAKGISSPAFSSVELLRDGEVVASAPCASATRCDLEGGVGAAWPGVWYAAVNGADGARLAVSSPVRVGIDADRRAGEATR
ncbi:MAG TPA: hypothetical protein VE404_00665 [Verrucomicrobiae bacterium]|nr:hypothetical protein [Verrucomicrobiae bacterium]